MYDTFFIFLNSFFHALISTSLVFFVIFVFGFFFFCAPIKNIFAKDKDFTKESIGSLKRIFSGLKTKECRAYVILFCFIVILQAINNFIIDMYL